MAGRAAARPRLSASSAPTDPCTAIGDRKFGCALVAEMQKEAKPCTGLSYGYQFLYKRREVVHRGAASPISAVLHCLLYNTSPVNPWASSLEKYLSLPCSLKTLPQSFLTTNVPAASSVPTTVGGAQEVRTHIGADRQYATDATRIYFLFTACDQCRRTKSKCEPSDIDNICRACSAMGVCKSSLPCCSSSNTVLTSSFVACTYVGEQ